jgi:hypothetical protein
LARVCCFHKGPFGEIRRLTRDNGEGRKEEVRADIDETPNVPAMEAAFVSVSDRASVPLTTTLTFPAILRPSVHTTCMAPTCRWRMGLCCACTSSGKHVEYLMRIKVVDSAASIGLGKGGFWEDRGYEWYAGI